MRPHRRLNEEARERIALYAVGALEPGEAAGLEAHLEACRACRDELDALRPVVEELASSVPPLEPPAHLKQRLLDRVRGGAPVQPWKAWSPEPGRPSLVIVRRDEGRWEGTGVAGVEVRRLHVDPDAGRVTMLVRMAPGSSYPAHRHAGVEECYVLEGDLYADEFEMRAGDYQRLEGGSVHGVQATRDGCLLFIVSSMRDELIFAAP